MYGSKQQNRTVGCAFLAFVEAQIVLESQFRLMDGSEEFAAEVHAIKDGITDGYCRGLRELDIYPVSRIAL